MRIMWYQMFLRWSENAEREGILRYICRTFIGRYEVFKNQAYLSQWAWKATCCERHFSACHQGNKTILWERSQFEGIMLTLLQAWLIQSFPLIDALATYACLPLVHKQEFWDCDCRACTVSLCCFQTWLSSKMCVVTANRAQHCQHIHPVLWQYRTSVISQDVAWWWKMHKGWISSMEACSVEWHFALPQGSQSWVGC